MKEKISLFAYNSGIKFFAAKGKVEVQAQADNVEITAQKVLKLLSATSNIEIAAVVPPQSNSRSG